MAEYMTLRAANEARQKEWDSGDQITLTYRATELGGEVGEALNVIKKIERERLGIRGSRATLDDLADELADVVICADLIAMGEGIDLQAAIERKFNATSERIGLATRLRLEAAMPVPDEVGEVVEALETRMASVFNYAVQGVEWVEDELCRKAASIIRAQADEIERLKARIAELEAACRNILPYLHFTVSEESPGHHPTMPSAVQAFEEAVRAACKAKA